MRVVQLLPTLAYGDAVGNDALALHGCLSQKGYKTLIYAENIDPRINKEVVKYYTEIPTLSEDDILLYHFSTGCGALAQVLRKCNCRKVMIYHNITPGKYFKPEISIKNVGIWKKNYNACPEAIDVIAACLPDMLYDLPQ